MNPKPFTTLLYFDLIRIVLEINYIPKKVLNKMLANFSLDGAFVTPLPTSGNIAYIVRVENIKYFLRLSLSQGPRSRSKNEILAEIELLNHLADNNFPVVRPIVSNKGLSLISWKNHYGYIRRFTNGKEKLNPSLKNIYLVGKTLGIFHKITENYKPTHKRRHIWDLEATKINFLEDKKIILGSRFFARNKNFCKKIEEKITALSFPRTLPSGIIHEDLGKRHVIWNKDRIAAFIDFDRSYNGKFILDIGQACRGWCFNDDWKKWSNNRFRYFLEGYQSERLLNNNEKKHLIYAIRFAILERAISFALRSVFKSDKDDMKFAWHSINELLDMIDQNEKHIKKIITDRQ